MNGPNAASAPRIGILRWRGIRKDNLFILGLVVALGLALGFGLTSGQALPEIHFGELLFWAVLILAMNLRPFTAGELSFTLDTPFLVTTALLYPPEVACLVAFVGSMDMREVLKLRS